KTVATGFLGGRAGRYIRRVLDEQGVVDECIEVKGETRTVWSIESGDGAPTTFNGKGAKVSAALWKRLVSRVEACAKDAEWVALGGSLPEGVPDDAYAVLGKVAREAGAKVLIDADGDALKGAITFCPDLIKPNQPEAERLLGRKLSSVEDAMTAAQELREKLAKGADDPIVIISRGSKGAVLAHGEKAKSFHPFKVEAKSTIGSGDSMLAGFLVGLLRRDEPEEAIKLGLAAGAATAESDGAHIARKSEVERLLG
ncbi:MAG: hexose kinase, partial [Armatimonadota bacterium]